MQRAGFVLVGGQSTRMGRDKALLPMGSAEAGVTVLAQHVAAQVKAVAGTATLVGSPERFGHLGLECIPDAAAGLGPLAGVHAALLQRRAAYNLIVACDMPGLSSDLLQQLFQIAEREEVLCAAAEDDRSVHPLCAVYSADALPILAEAVQTKQACLMDLLRTLGAVTLRLPTPLHNCNTPGEWRQFEATSMLRV